MKYGVLMHMNTQNLGDDIQAYASAQFLPSVDYMVDRETIDDFKSDDDTPVAVIMNAWYMWSKWRWPPSKDVLPKFLAVHYTDPELEVLDGSPVKNEFLTGLGKEYLNAHGPIGCRDTHTVDMLQSMGIDAYFSGCMTLTLPKMKGKKPEKEYICAVDVGARAEKKIRELLQDTDIEVKFMTSKKDYRNATASWEERKAFVEDTLTTYQNAKCVVTRRLHCALPCLAMDVPVLMVKKDLDAIRFHPYYDWMYCTTPDRFFDGEYNEFLLNPEPNLQKHLETREQLIKDAKAFVEQTKKMSKADLKQSKVSYSDEELLQWRNQTMKESMDFWLYETRKDYYTIKKLERDLKKTEEKITKLENKIESMQNSNSMKIGKVITLIPRKLKGAAKK